MTFDPTEVVQLAILNFVSSLAFGNRGRQDDPELKHLRSLLRNAVDNDPVNVHFCPILRFMPYYRNLIKVSKLFWNQESQFIMKKVKEIVDAGINEKSFVGAFVQSEGPNYDKADLREMTRNLLNAGSETTSFTVLNSLVLFANHPELQKRVQDEIDAGYNRQLFSSGFISFAVLTHFHRYWIVLVSFVERTLPCQRPLRVRVRLCTVLTYFGHLIRDWYTALSPDSEDIVSLSVVAPGLSSASCYFILILSTATSSATSSAAQAVVIHPCCYTERSLAQKEICTSFGFH